MNITNHYLWFHRKLTNIWIYFAIVGLFAALVLGIIAIISYYAPNKDTFIFHAYYFFGVSPAESPHEQVVLYLFIALLGIIFFNGLLITAFSSGVERYVERIRDGRKRFSLKHHYVMIGFNHYSSSIIDRILEDKHGCSKLVILTSKEIEAVRSKLRASLPEEKDNQVILYAGDGNTDKHVSKLNIDKAKAVYIMVEGNEWENQYTQSMTILKKISHYVSHHPSKYNSLLPVYLFINDTSSYNLVQRLNLPLAYLGYQGEGDGQFQQRIDLHVFNFYENWARLLWSYSGRKKNGRYVYDSLDFEPIEGTNKYVHLTIVGFNSMGRALLLEALRICHYPNFDEKTGENSTMITIIDPDVEKLKEQWKSQFPYLNQIKDICIDFIPHTVDNDEVRTKLKEWSRDTRQMLTIAICLSDPDSAITSALTLPEEMFYIYNHLKLKSNDIDNTNGKLSVVSNPTRPRILVRQHVKDSISDILLFNDTAYKNVKLFGTFLNGFDESLLDDDLSICVNGVYSDADCSRILLDESDIEQKTKDIPYESKFDEWKKKWLAYEQTPESFKMATRYQTDHYRILLPILERAHDNSDEDLKALIDALASTEHRRWIAERTLAGWRQAKEGEKRIDSLKIHTCITSHSKLPKDELIKDRNVVEFAPVLVEFVNKHKNKIEN